MGNCIYCGKPAGWFSNFHKECKQKNENAKNELASVISLYFKNKETKTKITETIKRLRRDSFLSQEDLINISEQEIRDFTQHMRLPYTPLQMHLVDDFINCIEVPYQNVNRNGAINEFAKVLIKGFMVEYFTDHLTLQMAFKRCQSVLKHFPMSTENINDAYYSVLNKAASNFLKDGLLNDSEQKKIDDFINFLSLPLNNLPAKYQDTDISKINQAAILKNLQNGILPQHIINAPILLGRGEEILWTYNNVQLYLEKITKEYIGRSGGFSFRIMKGVYYRTGGMKGHPVEHKSMEYNSTGSLYITNRNIIFQSDIKGVKLPYNKLIGITPYSDGIEVHREGKNQNRMTFQGFDSWFLLNVLSQISNL